MLSRHACRATSSGFLFPALRNCIEREHRLRLDRLNVDQAQLRLNAIPFVVLSILFILLGRDLDVDVQMAAKGSQCAIRTPKKRLDMRFFAMADGLDTPSDTAPSLLLQRQRGDDQQKTRWGTYRDEPGEAECPKLKWLR